MSTNVPNEQIQEWLQALDDVVAFDGIESAQSILEKLNRHAAAMGLAGEAAVNTPYQNTIPVAAEQPYPGDKALEKRLRAAMRWNASAMVLRAGKMASELGGHIASYASAATFIEVGFHHFFRASDEKRLGDLIFFQGHASPGIYARAFLEGRLTEAQLDRFRQEVEADGLSSYPHPWLMPNFWQFPTVSMGLGPLQAIYQARFLKYLHHRKLADTAGRKVWVFLGDGEMDEPESLGAINIARKEGLDNLIFVVNCNLQRLDGPVRGNGKIIQELEGIFRGADWHVLKVIWGGRWDRLFANDTQGWLLKRMDECVDGDFQNFRSKNGAYLREHFFNRYPELAALVADMTDDELWHLNRGGHDVKKVYNAFHQAVQHEGGSPTVILVKTVKGFGMGGAGEAQNITHQQKKMTLEQLKAFRDRFDVPVSDEEIADIPYYKPAEDSPEMQYLHAQRKALGGYLPERHCVAETLPIPTLEAFSAMTKDSGDREISTTMAFVRVLNVLMKDKALKQRIVPIVPDECRTFGMEGMFRQFGIYSPVGQLYTPEDVEQLMYYREAKDGQVLEEGITEAGGMSSWIAAGTSYCTNQLTMIPFFIYYSMFGFQRIGDLAWAAADSRAKGFLLGATAGRTTLAGEGLQHTDGHSHIFSSVIPNCISYDPAFAYEVAVIVQSGLKRMYEDHEDVFYYITLMNENYPHPAMPQGCEEGIIKGMYLLKASDKKDGHKAQLLGSGTILREVMLAAEMLAEDFHVSADVWSVTSFTELRREAMACERERLLQPDAVSKTSYVHDALAPTLGPIIAASDYMRLFADQIRAYVPRRYVTLGTDGFGRSDTREKLRHFFEVDAKHIAYTTVKTLAEEGVLSAADVSVAQKKYGINPEKPDPVTV